MFICSVPTLMAGFHELINFCFVHSASLYVCIKLGETFDHLFFFFQVPVTGSLHSEAYDKKQDAASKTWNAKPGASGLQES